MKCLLHCREHPVKDPVGWGRIQQVSRALCAAERRLEIGVLAIAEAQYSHERLTSIYIDTEGKCLS